MCVPQTWLDNYNGRTHLDNTAVFKQIAEYFMY